MSEIEMKIKDDMEFILVKTNTKGINRELLKDIVRVSFNGIDPEKKTSSLRVAIGMNIAKRLKLSDGDRISIAHAKEDPRVIFIRKESERGYKVRDGDKINVYLLFQLKWDAFFPDKEERRAHEVDHTYHQDGLVIKLK